MNDAAVTVATIPPEVMETGHLITQSKIFYGISCLVE